MIIKNSLSYETIIAYVRYRYQTFVLNYDKHRIFDLFFFLLKHKIDMLHSLNISNMQFYYDHNV